MENIPHKDCSHAVSHMWLMGWRAFYAGVARDSLDDLEFQAGWDYAEQTVCLKRDWELRHRKARGHAVHDSCR